MEPATALPSAYALEGRFGIVTGAASGIGQATAVHLARMGAGVALVDLDLAGLEETRARIERHPAAQLAVFASDAADEAEVTRVVEDTAAEFGTVDFLVNSAGILRRSAFLDIPVA